MGNKKLLTYKDTTLTKNDFYTQVNAIKIKFDSFNLIDDFVIINEENPIKFYTLLFALWDCDKKIIFPNKDFLMGENIYFAKYIATIKKITLNTKHEKVKNLDDNIYTVLFSSGSTGKPKGIVHTKDTFVKNAQSVLSSINIQNITSVIPLKPYLVSALSHFLVHLYSDSHLIFVDTDDLNSIVDISKNNDKLSYVGSPLHIISMFPFIKNKNPELFFSSGDIFYPSVIEDIINKFKNTIFFNVYGMAELGGRLFINKIDNSIDINLYKNIGKNINNTEVQIVNDEVQVKSTLLFKGYIIDNNFYKRTEDYFLSGDKVIKVDNHYEFFGRKNDEIKVAGNKVSMKYIEQKISLALSNDYTPIIINEEHNLIGNILVLVIYIQNDIQLTRKDIIVLLRKQLESYELPHKIYLTKKLPYTQTMKIDRKEIKNLLEDMELVK